MAARIIYWKNKNKDNILGTISVDGDEQIIDKLVKMAICYAFNPKSSYISIASFKEFKHGWVSDKDWSTFGSDGDYIEIVDALKDSKFLNNLL